MVSRTQKKLPDDGGELIKQGKKACKIWPLMLNDEKFTHGTQCQN